jgi:hypothetical protein
MSIFKNILTLTGIISCIFLLAIHIADSIEFILDPAKYMIGSESMISAGGLKYTSNFFYLTSQIVQAAIMLTTLCLYFARRNGYILLGGIMLWLITVICL